jgi:hypothetical protein
MVDVGYQGLEEEGNNLKEDEWKRAKMKDEPGDVTASCHFHGKGLISELLV